MRNPLAQLLSVYSPGGNIDFTGTTCGHDTKLRYFTAILQPKPLALVVKWR